MSINDPIVLNYDEKRNYYYLTRGRETFYDYENYLITFETQEEAIEFSLTNLNELPKLTEGDPNSTSLNLAVSKNETASIEKDGMKCYKPKHSRQVEQLSLDLAP